jgi:integrase/recombinase XerC
MSNIIIQEFIGYLRVEKKYSPKTCLSYEMDLKQFADFLQREFETEDILAIRHQPVRAWIVQMMSEDFKSTSVNRKISALRSFFKWALKMKKIEINPMLKVTAPKKPKKLPEVIPGANIMRLFEPSLEETVTENSFASRRNIFILKLLYATGIRRAELINLRTTDLDTYRKEIRVIGKGNKERRIPLTDTLLDSHRDYLDARAKLPNIQTDMLFVTEQGKPVYEKWVYNMVRSALQGITTLSKKSPHVLRHTFATHLLDEGADLNAIKELLGHASLAATQVYTHNSISKLREVYRKAHPEG